MKPDLFVFLSTLPKDWVCLFSLQNKDDKILISQKASLVNQKTVIVIEKVHVT